MYSQPYFPLFNPNIQMAALAVDRWDSVPDY